MLYKITNRTFVPAIPGDPGHPGRPYTPGFTSTVCSSSGYYSPSPGGGDLSSGDLQNIKDELESGSNVRVRRPSSPSSVTKSSNTTCRRVRHPPLAAIPPREPIPEVPEKFALDYQLGWNAKASALYLLRDSGSYSFDVPASVVGAVVGLSNNPRPTGYADIRHGFYMASGVVKIFEGGKEVASSGYIGNATYTIERRNGRIVYKIGSNVVRETIDDRAPVVLAAALYSGGDVVLSPELLEWNEATSAMTFPAMEMVGGTEAYSFGEMAFEPMTVDARAFPTASVDMAFSPMDMLASDAAGYAAGSMEFAHMEVWVDGTGVVPAYAIADFQMMPMVMVGIGEVEATGSGEMSFAPMEILGSQSDYAFGSMDFRPMDAEAYGDQEIDGVGFLWFDFLAFDRYTGSVELLAVLNANMQVTGLFVVQSERGASLISSLNATSASEVSALLYAAIESILMAGQSDNSKQTRSVWALNMDINGATRYEGYDFNSFAELDGVYYGAKSDGIYRLEGRTDNGEPVASSVNFGRLNFGTQYRKALPYLYTGVASDGNLFLRVGAEGQTYTYRVRDNTSILKAHRFELGRGLRANYYDLELVSEGTAFDLTDIEFFPIELSRRL